MKWPKERHHFHWRLSQHSSLVTETTDKRCLNRVHAKSPHEIFILFHLERKKNFLFHFFTLRWLLVFSSFVVYFCHSGNSSISNFRWPFIVVVLCHITKSSQSRTHTCFAGQKLKSNMPKEPKVEHKFDFECRFVIAWQLSFHIFGTSIFTHSLPFDFCCRFVVVVFFFFIFLIFTPIVSRRPREGFDDNKTSEKKIGDGKLI